MAKNQANISLGINIRVDTKKAEQEILREAVKHINHKIQSILSTVERVVGERFVARIKETAEYASIVSSTGQLRVEFGLLNPKQTMDNILAKLRLCFKTEYKKARIVSNRIEGTFRVTFKQQDFSFLYEEASFRSIFQGVFKRRPSTSYKSKGGKVDWLRWLLEGGAGTILRDVRIKYKEYKSPYPSRTGQAIMVPGAGWGVPSSFAGTTNDNWLTRTLAEHEPEVEQILNNYITEGLKNVGN